jgi:DNA-3-methyladenine glycosylase I
MVMDHTVDCDRYAELAGDVDNRLP